MQPRTNNYLLTIWDDRGRLVTTVFETPVYLQQTIKNLIEKNIRFEVKPLPR